MRSLPAAFWAQARSRRRTWHHWRGDPPLADCGRILLPLVGSRSRILRASVPNTDILPLCLNCWNVKP